MDIAHLKLALYKKCVEYVENRMSTIQNAIYSAKESADNETKSSAGDKHETGRAMMQLEQEKNAQQFLEALELKKALSKLDPAQRSDIVALGSIVISNIGKFYIAISAGKISIDNESFFAISPASPLGSILMGIQAGKEILFNNERLKIEKVA